MPKSRHESFEKLGAAGSFDVIVVGGGINGIGVFRELALQGLRVLLVERNDFCSGCSAAPSRMIHGGLRYLENGEFALVRESLRERDALLRNAPHLVKPLATTIPIMSVFSGLMNGAASFLGVSTRPARRGAVPVKLGLSIYDWVTRRRRMLPRHRFLRSRAAFRRWPKLTPRMRFAAVYHDAWISYPERLGVELVLDTCRMAEDAIALNHAEIASEGANFTVTDSETGNRYPVTAKAVVHATGAWLDESLSEMVAPAEAPNQLITGTKGSHLVLDNPELHDALGGHMVYFDNSDGRVCIVFGYLGRVLAGSTDIKVERAERVRCEDDERDYILDSLRLVFPDSRRLRRADRLHLQRHPSIAEERSRFYRPHLARAPRPPSGRRRSALLHDRWEVDDLPGLRRTHDRCGAGGARATSHDGDRRSWPSAAGETTDAPRTSRRTWCRSSASPSTAPRTSSTPTGHGHGRSWPSAPSDPTTGRSASAPS